MSQHATRPTPPPNAAPCTRAIVGFDRSASVREQSRQRPRVGEVLARRRSAAMRFIQLRSAPAQKLRPAPSSTTTRTLGVGVERVERVGELGDERLVERVVHVGPVERDERDGVAHLDGERGVHGAPAAAAGLRAVDGCFARPCGGSWSRGSARRCVVRGHGGHIRKTPKRVSAIGG